MRQMINGWQDTNLEDSVNISIKFFVWLVVINNNFYTDHELTKKKCTSVILV